MKNKLLIISILMMWVTLSINGQTWFNDNDTWISSYGTMSSTGYEIMYVSNDTIIDNKICQILKRTTKEVDFIMNNPDTITHYQPDFIVYESNDSVFYYNENMFELIYNFNLEPGDSIKIQIENCAEKLLYVIDSVKTITIGNVTRRIQYATVSELEIYFSSHNIRIVEGIGIVHGHFEFSNGNVSDGKFGYLIPQLVYTCVFDDPGWRFKCFENNDFSYNPNNEDCYWLPTITNTESLDNSENISISPNPVNDFLFIKTENLQPVQAIEIYSINGELIIQNNKPNNQLALEKLPTGVYIIRIKYNDKFYTEKILKN